MGFIHMLGFKGWQNIVFWVDEEKFSEQIMASFCSI